MVDMSCTIFHHGHVRLLRRASKLGNVVVALTRDEEILNKKGYVPELDFNSRKEILEAIKYVYEIVASDWLIEDKFIIEHNIDILVHGDDNENNLKCCETVIMPRTKGISSSMIRNKSYEIQKYRLTKDHDR